jgi:hypothetical protein
MEAVVERGNMTAAYKRVMRTIPLRRDGVRRRRAQALLLLDSDQSVQYIAQTFSKYQSFGGIFDRPDKYFWREVFKP